jgi:hypothetical protein
VATVGTILLDGLPACPFVLAVRAMTPIRRISKPTFSPLAVTIYFVMMGHAVYPDIIDAQIMSLTPSLDLIGIEIGISK